MSVQRKYLIFPRPHRRQFLSRKWLLRVVSAAAVSWPLGSGPMEVLRVHGQSPPAAGSAVEAPQLAAPLRIVKLLWKANPASAARTLTQSLTTAIERGEQAGLPAALQGMREEIAAVIAAGQADDPRFLVALSASLLADWQPQASVAIAQALEAATDPPQHLLLWRAWLLTQPQAAFGYLQDNLSRSVEIADSDQDARQAGLITAALATDRPQTARLLIAHWSRLSPGVKSAAIEPLTGRADSMGLLVEAVARGTISKDLINTNQLRKWLAGDQPQLVSAIEAVWGKIRPQDNAARAALVAETMRKIEHGAQGSAGRGAAVFDRVCAQCHVLHGRGYEVGPNIVGNGRGNLSQLISNILDPSLVIGEAFQAKTVLTIDGEVVSGLVAAENERYLTLKVQGGKVVEFDKQELEQIKTSGVSLMPEGVEAQMTPQELMDLLAYLCLLKPLDAADNELIPGTPVDFVQP